MLNTAIKKFKLTVLFLALNTNLIQAQFGSEFNLTELNGFNGFGMVGDIDDFSGATVTGIGDINNDGVDDVLVANREYFSLFRVKGGTQVSVTVAYVVFGIEANQFPNPISLSLLNGFNGFAIRVVIDEADSFQVAASAAGDINGDGINDLIIGLDGLNNGAGISYVVYGLDSAVFPNVFTLNTPNGLNVLTINGVNNGDNSGTAVGAAGDINGDGIDDLIIGANKANNNAGRSMSFMARTKPPLLDSSI